ncbi:Os06g0271475 [Oryza sativa Japonica Group]|uniref:Os06g0271475 protein n=1 Tax=Oryza sativa subsp. japonica TaxID=39947 RepID=C7J462_ORYSJ|nr:Os06g0271475 [Oryza sativa Japonica Group]|eukprot:NP_001174705.1 Os06g0271475 [Oryza sativa Japonica Group]
MPPKAQRRCTTAVDIDRNTTLMAPKKKGQAKRPRSAPKITETPLNDYELKRMRTCLQNNAMMRRLGVPALSSIVFGNSVAQRDREKNKDNDDPDFDANAEDDDLSEGYVSNDSLVPETEDLQNMKSGHDCLKHKPATKKSKKNTENVTSVTHHAIGGKRVVAPLQPGKVTRSKKHVAPDVLATREVLVADTQAEIPIQATSEVLAADTQAEIPIQALSEVNAAHTEEDAEAYEERWIRGPNVGRGLERMSRSKKGKLPVVIEPGKMRPNSVKIAAKFATECNIAVRNHVPIFPKWKDYKDNKKLLRFYINKVGSKFDMDTTAGPVRKACVAMMKRAVCQQRHKLKKKYFDPYPLHLVLKTSPVTCMSDLQWLQLVEHWKDEKKMLICEKNKANRAKVQFHQTTGSRSYDMHIIELAEMEMKIAEPVEDGCEPKSVNDAVSEVLAGKTKKNKFLVNVGINSLPVDSSAGSRRELQAALVEEKQTSADLRELVNIQRQQLDEMVKKMQAAEEERAKNDEEMKQRQAETDTLLRRLMAMIPSSQARI